MDVCYLCKSSKKDDIQYGDFLRKKNMAVHTFCLYLSSNLSQNGADDEGFLGFLEADIKKEQFRVSKLTCCYCHNRYANVGCCEKKCRHTFHFICGVENGAENQFCNSYKSFCHRHRRKDQRNRPDPKTVCLICYDNLYESNGKYRPIQMVRAPCCQNGWFHKLCLQKFAKTAGYFFKCPLCNDAKIFRQKLPAKGIFIPNQDAAWELEPNAFAELLERPSECAAVQCQNSQGRNNTSTINPLIFCSTCGSTAMHRLCLQNPNRFHCADCTAVSRDDRDSGRESLNSLANHNDEEHEEIDVCNVSDHENLELIQCLLSGNKTPACEQDANKCSSDEEIGTTRRSGTRLLSSDSDCSDLLKENRNPYTRNKSTSCSDDPHASSANEQKRNDVDSSEDVITNRMEKKRRILHIIEDDEVEVINFIKNNRTHQQRPKVQNTGDSDDSVDDEEERILRRNKTRSVKCQIGDNDDVLPAAPRKQQASSRKEAKERLHDNNEDACTRSSQEDYTLKNKRRRVFTIQSDDEDEDDIKQAIPKTVENSHNPQVSVSIDDDSDDEYSEQRDTIKSSERDSAISQATSEESDEDDDPLENFTKLIEKQKNISCVAQRTRTKSISLENPRQELNIKPDIGDAVGTSKTTPWTGVKPKTISFNSLPQQYSFKKDNLDVSCIAKRTRRKSMFCERRSKETNSNIKSLDQPENTFETSCIAIRTRGRRKTVCSETSEQKKKQKQQQLQLNERHIVTELELSSESATSAPSSEVSEVYEIDSDTYEDVDKFVVSDHCVEYEKDSQASEGKLSAFEISCIANRTRKRKSSKLQIIDEESSSSCSSSSYNSSLSSNQCNYQNKRCNSPATSSQESGTAPAMRYTEKWPKQNEELAFFNSKFSSRSKSHTQQSYHPSNHHHPHINNRRRI